MSARGDTDLPSSNSSTEGLVDRIQLENDHLLVNEDGSVVGNDVNVLAEDPFSTAPMSPTTLLNHLTGELLPTTPDLAAVTLLSPFTTTPSGAGNHNSINSTNTNMTPTTYLNQMLMPDDNTSDLSFHLPATAEEEEEALDLDGLLALEDLSTLEDALERKPANDKKTAAGHLVLRQQSTSGGGEPILTLDRTGRSAPFLPHREEILLAANPCVAVPNSGSFTTNQSHDPLLEAPSLETFSSQSPSEALRALRALRAEFSLHDAVLDDEATPSPQEALRALRAELQQSKKSAEQQHSIRHQEEIRCDTPNPSELATTGSAMASSASQQQEQQTVINTPLISNVPTSKGPARRLTSFDSSEDGPSFVTAMEENESLDSSLQYTVSVSIPQSALQSEADNKGWSPKLEPVNSGDALDVSWEAVGRGTKKKSTPSALDWDATEQFLFPHMRTESPDLSAETPNAAASVGSADGRMFGATNSHNVVSKERYGELESLSVGSNAKHTETSRDIVASKADAVESIHTMVNIESLDAKSPTFVEPSTYITHRDITVDKVAPFEVQQESPTTNLSLQVSLHKSGKLGSDLSVVHEEYIATSSTGATGELAEDNSNQKIGHDKSGGTLSLQPQQMDPFLCSAALCCPIGFLTGSPAIEAGITAIYSNNTFPSQRGTKLKRTDREEDDPPPETSPLSTKPSVRSPDAGEVFRSKSKPKSLEVEFPSLIDSGPKRSDVVSLSSASSTISHTSTVRGLLSVSGIMSTSYPEELVRRRSSASDSLPPRAPKKGESLNENQKSFAESVSKKLAEQENGDESDDERMETRWIKQSKSASFNPLNSIFAGKGGRNYTPDISPPGSPPEPVYASFDDDDEHSGSSGSHAEASRSSSTAALSFAMPPTSEAATWDMIAETGLDIEAEYDTSGGGGGTVTDHVATESSVLSDSEIAKSLARPGLVPGESFHSTVSKKRQGRNKARTLVHRGSTPSTSRHKRCIVPPCATIAAVQSEDPRFLLSRRTEEQDSLSLEGRRSNSMHAPSTTRSLLSLKHSSSPDLLAAAKKKSSEHIINSLSSPVHFLSGEELPTTPSRRENKPQLIVADSKATENLSPDFLAEKYDRQTSLCFTEPTNEGSLLEEELLALSSLEQIHFPFRYQKPLTSLNYLGNARWRQLVACWKHSEMIQSMTVRREMAGRNATFERTEDEVLSSTAGRRRGQPIADLRLNGVAFYELNAQAGKYFCKHNQPQSISSFLAEIGEEWASTTAYENLCHEVDKGAVDIDDLVHLATSTKAPLLNLIESTAAFASMNSHAKNAVSFSVDVKDQQVACRKALQKYDGDILRVKDILRARLCFPDEGSLVCGLCYLFKNTRLPNHDTEDIDKATTIELARIKNLFSKKFPLECLAPSPLPTGYRHVIVNVRFENGLLAEIQLNISPLFDVLGEEGVLLHRELTDLDGAFKKAGLRTFKIDDIIEDAIAGFASSAGDTSLFDAIQSRPAEGESDARSIRPPSEEFPLDSAEKSKERRLPSTPVSASRELSNVETDDGKLMCEMETPKAGHSAVLSTQMLRESTSKYTSELIEHNSDIQMGDVVLAVLECGSNESTENPRDVAYFYCLYAILSYLATRDSGQHVAQLGFSIKSVDDLIQYSLSCLLRCLKISNQALSIGMTGWLEYGSSSPLDQLLHRPFVLLRTIGYNFARRSQWEEAGCVLSALVVLCEQHLPMHHPTTLTAMLDLAIASRMIGKRDFGNRLLARSAERLSTHLAKIEGEYFAYLGRCRPGTKPVQTICSVERGRESMSELQSFVSLLELELSRDMTTLVDENHEIILVNHSFVADSLSVLANCLAAAVSTLGSSNESSIRRGDKYWRLAFLHYQRAFDGFARTRGLADPSVSRAAYGIARCLREFGETEKALELLTIVVSFSRNNPKNETEESSHERNEKDADESRAPIFLPRSLSLRSPMISNKTLVSKDTSAALCLWLMAILALDDSPNEEGRERAFSFLHAASVSLQIALNKITDADDEETKGMCLEFLGIIEEEAMHIAEPMMY